jgi:hypothetical protein
MWESEIRSAGWSFGRAMRERPAGAAGLSALGGLGLPIGKAVLLELPL